MKKYLFAFLLLLSPFSVFAAGDVTGSGFGTSNANQCFYDNSTTCGGQTTWKANDGSAYLVYTGGYYRVMNTLICPNDGTNTIWYYNNTTDPTSGSWTVSAGSNPTGSFSATGSCSAGGGGGGGGGTTASTSATAFQSPIATIYFWFWFAIIVPVFALLFILTPFRYLFTLMTSPLNRARRMARLK